MSRKLLLPLLIAGSMLAGLAPSSFAATEASQDRKISKARGAIKGLKKAISLIEDRNLGQTEAINRVDARVAALESKVTTVVSAATEALTKIQTALEDPVTGLRALNLARPKFASVTTSGTGATVNGATPGFGSAVRIGTGRYILNFGDDMSKRAAQLSINTPMAGAGVPFIGQVLNCNASDSSAAFCGNFLGGKGNVLPGHVFVEIQAETGSSNDDPFSRFQDTDGATFTVTEIAG